jgi:hypothetical protein
VGALVGGNTLENTLLGMTSGSNALHSHPLGLQSWILDPCFWSLLAGCSQGEANLATRVVSCFLH